MPDNERKPYNPAEIEPKWQKYWAENETFKTDVWDFSKGILRAIQLRTSSQE